MAPAVFAAARAAVAAVAPPSRPRSSLPSAVKSAPERTATGAMRKSESTSTEATGMRSSGAARRSTASKAA